MRLRTVSRDDPGFTRIRCGRGFRYVDHTGTPLPDDQVARIRALAIPPAWSEVWICADERGHLQAVGFDDAGRRQYLYHLAWREKRDAVKFDRVLEMASSLPRVRKALREAMCGDPASRDAVLAAAIRLVDLGCFRLGSDTYLEENGSYGLTTLERRALQRRADGYLFSFVAKAGVQQAITITDPVLAPVLGAISGRRPPDARLLSFKDGHRWRALTPTDVNERISELFRAHVSAKDFRTWHATVAVAVALAAEERQATVAGRKRQVRSAVVAASELLGNTPTVARSSYVDPRVIDLFEEGRVIGRTRTEDGRDRAVVALLRD